MSEANSHRPDDTSEVPRSKEDVAREIGAAPAGAAPQPSEDEALRDGGKLKLDKSGALAGRPKLRPVRAHRHGDDEEATRQAAREAARAGRPRKASLPPRLGALRPEGFAPPAAATRRDDEVAIEAGSFLYGDSRKPRDLPAFRIDRFPVTHADFAEFVRATGHREPLYWRGGGFAAELADHPVVGVDYYDALAYARWRGKDLPYEDEWERAARGTDGRTYPWGNEQELSGANTARVGLKSTVPVDLHRENVSPDGVRDLVGNVWELTHSPAPGGGVVVRGGSWYDFALYAKTFFRFASRPDARNGTIGFRCVQREVQREDAAREVDEARAQAEMASRRGKQPPVDTQAWSVEKRDLVADLKRVRSYVAELRAETLLGARSAEPGGTPVSIPAPPPPPPTVRAEPVSAPAPKPASEPAAERPTPASARPEAAKVPLPSPRVPAPEAKVVPGEPERLHVSAADLGSQRRRRPAPPAPAAVPVRRLPSARALPPWLWVLLAVGFLLFGGLLVMLLGADDPVRGAYAPSILPEAPEVERSRLADLPDALRYEEFPGANEPPRIVDAAFEGDLQRLEQGLWLLLFVDPTTSEGLQTLEAAHALHRRVAPRGVHVTVVLPRAPYEQSDGSLLSDRALDAALRADGGNWLWDGMHVVLDPAGQDGRGRLHARHASAAGAVSAVLLHDGIRDSRTAPPVGGFREETLVAIALRALELAP